MRLGIDFDNTIVCYDTLFHRVALEGGWIPADLPANKSDVRNHLRAIGREDVWTEMQGRVYGPRLAEASPYPGVREFFLTCRAAGIPVFIVSHKTKTPFAGEPHDLHQAAIDWLTAQGFFDPGQIGLPRSSVFLELTKQAKLQRIGACQCTHFIDDLPEFLAESAFPSSTTRILFDPNRLYGAEHPFTRLHDWTQAADLTGLSEARDLVRQVAELLPASSLPPGFPGLEPIPGGANNRVYRIHGAREPFVLKRYFQSAGDPRDRFAAEHAFYDWIQARGIRSVPAPVTWDTRHRLGLLRLVEGRKLAPGELGPHHVGQAIEFVLALNRERHLAEAARIPTASEACFTVADHLERIAGRVDRLTRIQPESALDAEASLFVRNQLVPRWQSTHHAVSHILCAVGDTPLPPDRRCLSPSDFGFHNALLTSDGSLRFLDFEYAGWDDPAKLICDFFCQPRIPVDLRHWPDFVSHLDRGLGWDGSLPERSRQLLPAYRIKWCCILLNEFLRTGLARRAFAGTVDESTQEERKSAQLEKARQALAHV